MKKEQLKKQLSAVGKVTIKNSLLLQQRGYLADMEKLSRIEHEIAKLTSDNFLNSICPVLRELSSADLNPFSSNYLYYLDEVKAMILRGDAEHSIRKHFENKLIEMKERGKQSGSSI